MTKTFFITGSTGFIGANLVRKLIENKENKVHILTREKSNLWRIKDILNNSNLFSHTGDLLEIEGLKKILHEIRPDYIIHTAVYGGLPSEKDISKITQTNYIGTVNLLEASKGLDYKYFINTGSSSEYGKKNSAMKESDILEPNTQYGISKAAATHYCNNFAKKENKPIVTLRLFSPYGEYEEKDRLFPYVIKTYLQNESLKIGNSAAVRDFIQIKDVVNAYLSVINSEKLFYGEIFNVGSGKQHSVKEVIDLVYKNNLIKPDIILSEDKKRAFDTEVWVADISKIKRELGWQADISFSEGIEKTIDWFRKNYNVYENTEIEDLKRNANKMKMEIAKILEKTYGSHIGGDYSVLDILNVLYFKIMNIDPKNPKMINRDKLILSKGHNSLALYSILAKRGFFEEDKLQSYCQNGSCFEGHVNYHGIPGIEVSTGSLGHGLAVGIGMALANKKENNPGRIFVIVGDGECNEGSVWEAAILASRLKLDNLIVIVDANGSQGLNYADYVYGNIKLIEMWKSFGFSVRDINGHDYEELIKTFNQIAFEKDKPSLVYANTIKGKGISFMENKLEWHYKSPNKEQLKIIEEELKK
jgi:transketolase